MTVSPGDEDGAMIWTPCPSMASKVVRRISCRRSLARLFRVRLHQTAYERKGLCKGCTQCFAEKLIEKPQALLGKGKRIGKGKRGLGPFPLRRGIGWDAERAPSRGASSATVGASKKTCSGTAASMISRIRETACVASSEWPPIRRSYRRYRPGEGQHLGKYIRQPALVFCARCDSRSLPCYRRHGQGRSVDLPLAVSGKAANATNVEGTM